MTAQDRWPCLVRVLNKQGFVSGAGFLADERHVVTCAHVVPDNIDTQFDIRLNAQASAVIVSTEAEGHPQVRVV